MNEREQLISAIITVVAIVVAVVGATYAYWSWTSSNNDRTNVTFNVPNGTTLLSANLDGGTMTVSKLAPVESCTNATYAKKATVVLTYTNGTSTNATATGTLTVSGWTNPHGAPSTADLGRLHYALTTSDSACDSGVITGASGTFAGKTSGALFSNVILQSGIAPGTTNGSKTMYLYVWLDSDYAYTNAGSGVVSDPMEDLSFTLTWSGQITNQTS